MKIDVVGFGALNYDYMFVVDKLASGNQQVIIKQALGTPGGSSANTIYSLSKLGIKTGFFGAVGDDVEGAQIKSQMQEIGIDISRIRKIHSKATSKVFVFVDSSGERAMYSLPGASTSFRVNKSDIIWLSDKKFIIISSAPGKEILNEQRNLIANIKKSTKTIFIPGALYARYGFSELEPILTNSDIVILNSRETLELTGRKFQVGAKWLIKKGCKIVVITLGRQGCFIYYSKKSRIIPTIKLSDNKIVDSTGAGDAFAAGLVYGLLNKFPLSKAALLGNLNARFCIQGLGARSGLPDEITLINEFRKYSKVIENE